MQQSDHIGDSNKMITRPTQWIVGKADDPIFAYNSYTLEIKDEAAGEFVEIRCSMENEEDQKLTIDPHEWPQLRKAINRAIKQCRKEV